MDALESISITFTARKHQQDLALTPDTFQGGETRVHGVPHGIRVQNAYTLSLDPVGFPQISYSETRSPASRTPASPATNRLGKCIILHGEVVVAIDVP